MSTPARFSLKDREMRAEPLHYKMCGLDDIYLLNGFTRHKTPHGNGVAIEKADELHHAIGLHLIKNRKVLSPKDVKFLRRNMDLTQEELGGCLGVTDQTIARYEKGTTEIPGPADRMIRVVYALHLIPEDERSRVIEELMAAVKVMRSLDETADEPVYFGNTPMGWDKATYASCCVTIR